MPRGIKRTAPVDVSRRECKQSASAACNGVTKLSEYYRDSLDSRLLIDEESPTRNAVGYHLVDHEYGVTPKNQIIHGDPVEPPRSTHVSIFTVAPISYYLESVREFFFVSV